MNGPPAGGPAWLPDPTGRHELRWWDGTGFTDQVADRGATGLDPYPPPAPPSPAPPVTHPALPPDVTGRRPSRLPLILAAAGAFVVVIALLVLVRDDGEGGAGTGRFEGEVGAEPGRHEVRAAAGEALIVTVEPDDGLDAAVGFEIGEDDVERLRERFDGTVVEPMLEATQGLVFLADAGFEGDGEVTLLAAPFEVAATVVVDAFGGDSEGAYEITIEAIDLALPADASGDDVIEALLDHDDLPDELRRRLDALLD